jgi:hypothetical protein
VKRVEAKISAGLFEQLDGKRVLIYMALQTGLFDVVHFSAANASSAKLLVRLDLFLDFGLLLLFAFAFRRHFQPFFPGGNGFGFIT